MIYLIFILVFIAGIAKAIMDTLQFHFEKSIFYKLDYNYWLPSISWQNKYSDLTNLVRKKWLGIILMPVALTDAYHLFQSIFLTTIFAAMALSANTGIYIYNENYKNVIIEFVALRATFGFAFVLFYNYILIKKV